MIETAMPLAFWLCAAFVWRPSRWRVPARRADWLIRLFVLGMALSLTLQNSFIAPRVDDAFGISNVAHALGYAITIAAATSAYIGIVEIAQARVSPLPFAVAALTLTAIGVWLPAVAREPSIAHPDSPITFARMMFQDAIYIYLFILGRVIERHLRAYLVTEANATARVRLRLIVAATEAAQAFAVTRAASWAVGVWVSAEGMQIGALVSGLLLALCAFSATAAFLPTRWLDGMLGYVEQQRAVCALERERRRLATQTPALPWAQPGWRKRILNPTYALYTILIDILDRRSLLATTLSEDDDTDDWLAMALRLQRVEAER